MSRYFRVFTAPVKPIFEFSLPGFRSHVARSIFSGEIVLEHCEPVHRVYVTLAGKTRSTIAEADAAPPVRRPDQPGSVTIVPAGLRRRVALKDGDILILNMAISDSFIRLVGADGENRTAAQPPALQLMQNGRNDWLVRAAHAFAQAGFNDASTMHMQSLALMIARHLARLDYRGRNAPGLDPAALSRLVQLMQDRLADDLTLTDLAQEAGLSISALSRAFQSSMGTTPYQFFTQLRMDKAKNLLANSKLSLAEIAGAVGYADQSHFTAAFTRCIGISPGRWRSQQREETTFSPISRKTDALNLY